MGLKRVLVTGAHGYIGSAIAFTLMRAGFTVHGGIRRDAPLLHGLPPFFTGDLADAELDLSGFDAVVHAAGMGHRDGVSAEDWSRSNVDTTANLARRARAAGVRCLVFISSAYVLGRSHEGTVTDDTPPNPRGRYATSKLLAEQEARRLFGAGLSVLRPAAVIGPHCPGNLQRLMRLLRRGLPLPLGAITNWRSFVHIGDLARIATLILSNPAAPEIVLAASPETISTPDLARALAKGMGVDPWLPKISPSLLGAMANLTGRQAMWESIAGNFIAVPRAALSLGWEPRTGLVEQLIETGRYYAVS